MTWLLLLLLQSWTQSQTQSEPGVVLKGNWQSCINRTTGEYEERIYDHLLPPVFEFHMGPRDEFALFPGVQDDHRAHEGPENLLGPRYRKAHPQDAIDRRTWHAYGLTISVALAGGSLGDCESYFVEIRRG